MGKLQPKKTVTVPDTTIITNHTPAPLVSSKRNDDVKIKNYFMFEKANLTSPLHNLANEVPITLRAIIAGFAVHVAQKLNRVKLNITRTLDYSQYIPAFNDIQCEDIENDYEDLGQAGSCPLCHKTIDAPYYYTEIAISKGVNVIISLKLLEHLLNDHNFSVPPQFAAFVFNKYFSNLPIIKPLSEMDRDELIIEVTSARKANDFLAHEMALMKAELISIKGSLVANVGVAVTPEEYVSSPPIKEMLLDVVNGSLVHEDPNPTVAVLPVAVEVGDTEGFKSDDVEDRTSSDDGPDDTDGDADDEISEEDGDVDGNTVEDDAAEGEPDEDDEV
jgi:hypothetical protein